MTWFASSANQTASEKDRCWLIHAVDLTFFSGHGRWWSGEGVITINGNQFVGAGIYGSVTPTKESALLVFERKVYTLSGIDIATIISENDIDHSFGQSIIEYLGWLDPDTGVVVDVPEIPWEGEITKIRRVDGRNPQVEVHAQHRLSSIDRADEWRWTHQHQQEFFSGDNGFSETHKNEDKDLTWGGRRITPGIGGGGGGIRPIAQDV